MKNIAGANRSASPIGFNVTLLLNDLLDLVAQVRQYSAGYHRSLRSIGHSRASQVNRQFTLYPARTRSHAEDTVSQGNRLHDVVRHKKYGFSGFQPDPLDF